MVERRIEWGISRISSYYGEKFAARDEKNDAQFKALMAESKAQAELTNMRMITALSERVAVLESQRH